jgi:hypothetical protein
MNAKYVSVIDIYVQHRNSYSPRTLGKLHKIQFPVTSMYYKLCITSSNTEVSRYYSHIYRGAEQGRLLQISRKVRANDQHIPLVVRKLVPTCIIAGKYPVSSRAYLPHTHTHTNQY